MTTYGCVGYLTFNRHFTKTLTLQKKKWKSTHKHANKSNKMLDFKEFSLAMLWRASSWMFHGGKKNKHFDEK